MSKARENIGRMVVRLDGKPRIVEFATPVSVYVAMTTMSALGATAANGATFDEAANLPPIPAPAASR